MTVLWAVGCRCRLSESCESDARAKCCRLGFFGRADYVEKKMGGSKNSHHTQSTLRPESTAPGGNLVEAQNNYSVAGWELVLVLVLGRVRVQVPFGGVFGSLGPG